MPIKTDWKKVLESARRDLDELRVNRDELEAQLNEVSSQIVQLEQLVTSLQPMASEVPQEAAIIVEGVADLELADAIREVLKQSDQYRTPRGVRDSLRSSSYDLDQHTNPLASVHSVLKRLVSSREAEQLESKGKTYYRWKTTGPQSSDWIETLKRSIRPREHGPFNDQEPDMKVALETRLKKRG